MSSSQPSFLRERGLIERLDTFPFLVAYSVGFYGCFAEDDPKLQTSGLFMLPAILIVHIILFFAQSSASVKAFVGYSKVSSVESATHVLITDNDISSKRSQQDIVRIFRDGDYSSNKGKPPTSIKILGQPFLDSSIRFEYKKTMYGYNSSLNKFDKIEYPVEFSVEELRNHKGYLSSEEILRADKIWGRNSFDIPLPGFLDLYVEHLVAPFFVFQILCLFLWSLDDYWYYSIITLFMLMFLEGVLCKQRLTGILTLRKALKPPCYLRVFRNGRWGDDRIKSDDLHPGDIISLITELPGTNISIPSDCLLISGTCIVNEAMLTGESVPQIKESVNMTVDDSIVLGLDESNINPNWKMSYVYSGTTILQHSSGSASMGGCQISAPPDGGCIAVVIRTGFRSTQGALMRKILFSNENIHDNSSEIAKFIGVLVFFAAIAASAVLYHGVGDPERNKFRLVLHCIMIITSVIPPELPMELSLAVTTSLSALGQHYIFCTEPFRIALAGKVSTLCFDKTGTLTKDEMILSGIALIGEDEKLSAQLENVDADCPVLPKMAMAACQNCFVVRNTSKDGRTESFNLCGDPLEMAAVKASGFKFMQDERNIGSSIVTLENIQVVSIKRFAFSSTLKRMSVISQVSNFDFDHNANADLSSTISFVAFTKGAPEVLKDFIIDPPSNYDSICKSYMTRGKRVVTLAYKVLFSAELRKDTGPVNPQEIMRKLSQATRESTESNLIFLGFLVFDCEMKPDTKSVMQELIQTNNESIMITGDSAYTAVDVAKSLHMIRKDNIAITKITAGNTISWEVIASKNSDITTDNIQSFDEFSKLKQDCEFCMTGDVLSLMESKCQAFSLQLASLVPMVKVFARVSPEQKELIVKILNDTGSMTLMCGDGTNDVGALKAAHVGVSIVNNPTMERILEKVNREGMNGGNAPSNSESALKKKKSSRVTQVDRDARARLELDIQQQEPSMVQLGDASIASPFTARRTSIDVILTILRAGRCTLVTSIQVYKVLALNCLVSAYMMSALFLSGLKVGDIQMTAQGLMTASLFFALSQAKPLTNLSSFRPPSTVFAKSVLFSIIGQVLTHLGCIVIIMQLATKHVNLNDPSLSPDGKFRPNIVNSSLFLLSLIIQVNSFITNYRGHPFTMKLTDHVLLFRTAILIYFAVVLLVGQQFQPLNDFLQLVPFPDSAYQGQLLSVFLGDFVLCYGIEMTCRRME